MMHNSMEAFNTNVMRLKKYKFVTHRFCGPRGTKSRQSLLTENHSGS